MSPLRTRYNEMIAGLGRAKDRVFYHPVVAGSTRGAKTFWAYAVDICYPLVVVVRGVARGIGYLRRWWSGSSKERRRITIAIVLICALALYFVRYGLLLMIIGLVFGAAWLGRDTTPKNAEDEPTDQTNRLQAVYNGLVPYFMDEHDPDQVFRPGGSYKDAFTAWEFDDGDRLTGFTLRYSPFFRDGEAESRAKIEHALEGKIGHDNEYLYDWDEEGNRLAVQVLPPLPTGIRAATWKVADIEYVLGFTDTATSNRLIPVQVTDADGSTRTAELAPVIWRPGPLGHERHLLLAGDPGSGKTNALRSLAMQALARSHTVAIIDTERTGEFADLAGTHTPPLTSLAASALPFGRPVGGLAQVVSDLDGALELLGWFGTESGRRAHTSAGIALSAQTMTSEIHGPMWLIVDELPALADAALRAGKPDPQDLLADLMRMSSASEVTVVVGSTSGRVATLHRAVRNQAMVRVGLGSLDSTASRALFDGTLDTSCGQLLGPGRGYARVGASGQVVRLQVPFAAPDRTARTPLGYYPDPVIS